MFLFRFIFYFFVVLFVIGIIARFFLRVLIRRAFGKNQPNKQQQNASKSNFSAPQKKKIISKNQGDYIDFEEIK